MDNLRKWLIPAVFVIVACHHFYKTQFEGLSSWRGGGFGMYGSFHPNHHDMWQESKESPTKWERKRFNRKSSEWRNKKAPHAKAFRPILTDVNQERLEEAVQMLEVGDKVSIWRPSFNPRTMELTRVMRISAAKER